MIVERVLPALNLDFWQVQSALKEGGALQLTGECKDSISYTSRIVNIRLRSNTELVYNPFDNPALETTLTKCPL